MVFDGFKAFQLTLKGDRRSSQILNFLSAGDVIIEGSDAITAEARGLVETGGDTQR